MAREAVQAYAVVGEKVGFGPMSLTYARVFAAHINARSVEQFRVITFWGQIEVANEKKDVRVN